MKCGVESATGWLSYFIQLAFEAVCSQSLFEFSVAIPELARTAAGPAGRPGRCSSGLGPAARFDGRNVVDVF